MNSAAQREPRSWAAPSLEKHALKISAVCALLGLLAIQPVLGLSLPRVPLLTVIYASAALAFILWPSRGTYDIFHPVRLFGSLWCFCLALGPLRLATPISDWDAPMWFYTTGALVSFIFGFWLAGRRRRTGAIVQQQGAVELRLPDSEILPSRRGLVIAFLCLLVGMSALGYEYYALGEIPVLATDVNISRMRIFNVGGQLADPAVDTITIKLVHQFVPFSKYAVYLACILLFQRQQRPSRKVAFILVLVLLAGVLAYGSQGGRGFIHELLVACAVLFHYLRRRIRLRHALGLSLALVLLISVGQYMRLTQKSFSNRSERFSALPRGPVWDLAFEAYFTFTVPLEVFYRLTKDLPSQVRSSSGFLFYSLHRLMPRENIQALSFRLYTGEMIVPTFLAEFYADFGVLGIILGPGLLGLAYGYIYSRAIKFRSIYVLWLQANLCALLTYFPYFNPFSFYLGWLLDAVAMAWLTYLAKQSLRETGTRSVFHAAPAAAGSTQGGAA